MSTKTKRRTSSKNGFRPSPPSEVNCSPSASSLPTIETLPVPVVAKREPDPHDAVMEEMSQIVARVKDAIEEKNWRSVADQLGLEEVYLNGHPEPVSELIAKIEKQTQDLFDFEPVLKRILVAETSSERARFTVLAKLMWHSIVDWQDHEAEQTIHLGFVKEGLKWKPSHLGFSAPPSVESVNPQPVIDTDTLAADGTSSNKAPSGISANRELDEWTTPEGSSPQSPVSKVVPRIDTTVGSPSPTEVGTAPIAAGEEFFTQMANQYISSLAPEPQSAPQAAKGTPVAQVSSDDSRHHVVLMPVVMHEDLVRQLFPHLSNQARSA